MVAGAGSNRRPWGYESPSRQNLKYLPFQKLQPPRISAHFAFFTVPHSRFSVLFILDTNWTQRFHFRSGLFHHEHRAILEFLLFIFSVHREEVLLLFGP